MILWGGEGVTPIPGCNLRHFLSVRFIIGGRSMNPTMNKTMKTVAIDRFGGLNEMKIRELPVPELDANEILVRVEAAGVGVWDPFEREGFFAKEYHLSPKFPIILGSDGAGT